MTDELDKKLNEYYAGKVVRKDLTKLIKEGMNVPSYVLEYLLGMYCATDDEEDIVSGTAMVKQMTDFQHQHLPHPHCRRLYQDVRQAIRRRYLVHHHPRLRV